MRQLDADSFTPKTWCNRCSSNSRGRLVAYTTVRRFPDGSTARHVPKALRVMRTESRRTRRESLAYDAKVMIHEEQDLVAEPPWTVVGPVLDEGHAGTE